MYVGESARSGGERMGEHLEDAKFKRKDSHIYKHWSNQHGGRSTEFSFKIINFFSSPLDRQVAEAVRILHTGATRILNSKGMFNRCSLPRIVVQDVPEETTLGDSEGEKDVQPEPEAAPVMSKKQARLSNMRDLENWGMRQADEMG